MLTGPASPLWDHRLRMGAIALMISAGGIHLAIAPQHWSHSPVHGLSMALIGVLEIGWGVIYWCKPSPAGTRWGLLIGIGFISLWAITRVAPDPVGHGLEQIDTLGMFSKLCEALGAAALVPLIVTADRARANWRAVGALAAAAVMGAWLAYGVAFAAQPLLAGLNNPAAHHADHSDGDRASQHSDQLGH